MCLNGTSFFFFMKWISFYHCKGFDSVMVDGSHLPFKDNISYTTHISNLAHLRDMLVEAELGRLSGMEDDLTVEDYEAKLTDINQVTVLNQIKNA